MAMTVYVCGGKCFLGCFDSYVSFCVVVSQ